MSCSDTRRSTSTLSNCRQNKNKRAGKLSRPPITTSCCGSLNLALQENGDHEPVERQRFEQREGQHQWQEQPVGCIGIASDTFHGCRAYAPFAQSGPGSS